MPGTERFQKLCSFEYLQLFKAVRLHQTFDQANIVGAKDKGVARSAEAFEAKRLQLIKPISGGGQDAAPAAVFDGLKAYG